MPLSKIRTNRTSRSLRRDPHERRPSAAAAALAQAQRSGGPQDRALYACNCGMAFEAEVTTSVGCPHCGTAQAW